MAEVLTYVIFMTYDLHGQWDYGNLFSDLGGATSGCLCSDVNLTETLNAVFMITKLEFLRTRSFWESVATVVLFK
jgi:chitinase